MFTCIKFQASIEPCVFFSFLMLFLPFLLLLLFYVEQFGQSKILISYIVRKHLFGLARNDQRLYRFFATFFMWNVTYLRCRFWASPASGC